MVKPGDSIVAIAELRDRAKEVVEGCGKARDGPGSRPWPEAGRTNQCLGEWALGNSMGLQHGQGLGYPGVGGFCGHARKPNNEVLLFVAGKVERLVLYNGSAHRETIVFIAQPWRFWNGRTRYEERRMRAIEFVPVVVVEGAVDLIPAGLGRSEEHTSELQSLRHLVCRLLLEKKK